MASPESPGRSCLVVLGAEEGALGCFPGQAGCWAAQALVFSGLLLCFIPPLPRHYLNKTYFTEGLMDCGVPRHHLIDAVDGLFRIQARLRDETLTEIQRNGSCIPLGREYMKCSSQDLLEERAGTQFLRPAGNRDRGKGTNCPPHHTCFLKKTYGYFSNLVKDRKSVV